MATNGFPCHSRILKSKISMHFDLENRTIDPSHLRKTVFLPRAPSLVTSVDSVTATTPGHPAGIVNLYTPERGLKYQHTNRQTQTHTHTHTHTHTYTHTLSLSLSHTHTHTHASTYSQSFIIYMHRRKWIIYVRARISAMWFFVKGQHDKSLNVILTIGHCTWLACQYISLAKGRGDCFFSLLSSMGIMQRK